MESSSHLESDFSFKLQSLLSTADREFHLILALQQDTCTAGTQMRKSHRVVWIERGGETKPRLPRPEDRQFGDVGFLERYLVKA